MEIEIGCPQFAAGPHAHEPDLGNEDANAIGREMLDIAADLGVRTAFSVAANPDGSILVCVHDNEAMADETEKRANELGIAVTVSTECPKARRYGS